MLQSPPKRRRLNDSTVEVENDSNPTDDASLIHQPTTPTRASYLSPTKSSLSRSHPHLVNKSISRSTTEPRSKSLRDEILRPPSKTSDDRHGANDINHSEDAASGVGIAKDSAREAAIDTNQSQFSQTPRPASSRRQIRASPPSDQEGPPEIFKPTLVPKPILDSRLTTTDRSEELVLPPTPVQLGLNTLPHKPRGLASSSSPGGSKHGSGKRRRRRTDDPATSSPLKPRHADEDTGELAIPDMEQSLIDEAQESEIDDTQDVERASDPIDPEEENENETLLVEPSEKESTLQSLRSQLEKLKMEVSKLDAAVENDKIDDSIISLLFPSPAEAGNFANPLFSTATDEEKAAQYLTLFAPGDMRLSSSTETKKVDGRTKIVHTLSLTAPPPWPVHTAMFTFEVVVDAEDAQVEQVTRKYNSVHKPRRGPPIGIHKWVVQRLGHPLHQLDVGGIIWGVGQWFAASVERARIFHQLDLQSAIFPGKPVSKTLTERDAITLLPYLYQTQCRVGREPGTKRSKKKILLVWDINIDWTGEVKSDIDIVAHGVSATAELGLKAVFRSLIPVKGVPIALEHVNTLLQGHHNDDHEPDSSAKEPSRRRKRKRVVL